MRSRRRAPLLQVTAVCGSTIGADTPETCPVSQAATVADAKVTLKTALGQGCGPQSGWPAMGASCIQV